MMSRLLTLTSALALACTTANGETDMRLSQEWKGNWGNSVDAPATSLATRSLPIIELRAPKGMPPMPLTVVVDAFFPDTANRDFRGYARIQWGAGGASSRAEVDIRRGTSFTIIADYLRITADYISPTDAGRIWAFAAPAVSHIPIAPTRTVYHADSIAIAAESNVQEVPAFAVEGIWIPEYNGTGGISNVFINYYSVSGGGRLNHCALSAGGANGNYRRAPVPIDARFYTIENQSTKTLIAGQQVMFRLAL